MGFRLVSTNAMILVLAFVVCSLSSPSASLDTFDAIDEALKRNINGSSQAVTDLAERLLGDRAKLFNFTVWPELKTKDNRDVFQVVKTSDVVEVVGSSGVAAAWGLHHYLKQYCHCHVSWSGDQLHLPNFKDLPDVNITVVANHRYYQNVCTTSYSFVWWNWTRWERELDWAALNGYNLVLAFTGMEAVVEQVYRELGLTTEEIQDHFTGPAFLAWNRMGNIRGYGGPLTQNWQNQQVELQRRILTRMRSLGIIPVLPAFAGHVPKAITRIYPNATVIPSPTWADFTGRYSSPDVLNATDPLFKTIGNSFMRKMVAMFGTDHFYNCDTFNEMDPSHLTTEDIRTLSSGVFQSMTDYDNKAIWIMQGWIFSNGETFWTRDRSQALLTSVPIGRMLVLDLQSELNPQFQRLENYFGQPFIWCMLHNFGGTLGLQGAIQSINENILKVQSANLAGTGITPEGINTNYVVYDLMSEMGWRHTPVNLSKWFVEYSRRRYGENNEDAEVAWQLLGRSVYNYTGKLSLHGKYVFTSRPSLTKVPVYWYDYADVFSAWKNLLKAGNHFQVRTSTFNMDLIDVTRQSIQILLDSTYLDIVSAFKKKNVDVLKTQSQKFTEMLKDMDEALATNENFLLGIWLRDAKLCGVTPLEKELYERTARNQITLWGPDGQILDYANKQWSGVVRDYFLPRWTLFFDHLSSLNFNSEKFKSEVFSKIEQPFTFSRKNYTDKSNGDPFRVSLNLYGKWTKEINQLSISFSRPVITNGSLFLLSTR